MENSSTFDANQRYPSGAINSASGASDIRNNRQLNLKSTLLTGNIQGICSVNKGFYKISRLSELASENNSLIISLTESHVNENILDAEIAIKGYDIFKRNRQTGIKKGGILTYIRSDMAVSAKELTSGSIGMIEYLCIYIKDINVLLVTVYRPPENNNQNFTQVLKNIDDCIKSLESYPSIIFTGDMNLPNINFLNGEATNNSNTGSSQSALINFANDHFLTQLIEEPTRLNNILDLLYTNNEDLFAGIEVQENNILSDHRLIVANLTILCNEDSRADGNLPQHSLRNLNFFDRNVDWEKINQEIANINWEAKFNGTDINENFDYFCAELLNISEKYVPKRKTKRERKPKIPRHRHLLIRKKRALYRKIYRNTNQTRLARLKSNIASIEQQLKLSYDNERRQKESKATECIKQNPKYFFTYSATKSKIKFGIGPFMKDGEIINNAKKKAEILREQFESVFSTSPVNDQSTSHQPRGASVSTLQDFDITEEDIINQIKKLRKNAAAGPDNIPAILLKNCSGTIASPICQLWKKSLEVGCIPEILKTGIITPIFKGGDRTQPQNYRPVSLTSHVIKLFESLIRTKIENHLVENDLFNENQHGFRKGRSCISQLLDHYNKIIEDLENGHRNHVIYLDFAKAFDKVHHTILLQKLQNIGITGKLHVWIKEFLCSRKQTVSVEGHQSENSDVLSGVPQGSVLGPLLFLIHIGDIDEEISNNSTISCFADDTRIMRKITQDTDCQLLQEDLNSIYGWADKNKMKFNDKKFESIHYQPNRQEYADQAYSTGDGSLIEQKSSVRDLGIMMSNDATFKENIGTMVKRGKRMAGWALRTFQSRDKNVMLTLYKALIRPFIEYGCQVWSPQNIGEIRKLENVQRAFTRKIDGMEGKNYWQRLKELNLNSLERRRERYIIMYTWKIIYDLVPNITGENKIQPYSNDRFGIKCKLPRLNRGASDRIKTCKDSSFVFRGPKLFNCIPKDIREFHGTPEDLKTRLDKFLKSVPDKPILEGREYSQAARSNSLDSRVEQRIQ